MRDGGSGMYAPMIMASAMLLLGYALGAVPFGVLLTRLGGAGDLRAIGSGNIGATNVLRTGRRGLAAATLLLDMLKGTAAVLIARALVPGTEGLAAAGAVLGHMYPIWLRFRGGKGVATLFGVAIGLHWPSGLVYAAVWLGMLAAFRISSLAGMTAAMLLPVGAALLGRFDLAILHLGLGLLVVWKHRDNLERLIAGTEPHVGRPRDG